MLHSVVESQGEDSISFFSFAAIRGVQAGREYFVTMCPLKLIPKLFLFDEEELDLPPEVRAQRTLNKSRIPKITRYISENYDSYVFSSLTVSVDARFEFHLLTEKDENRLGQNRLGYLQIPMDANFVINDGQHRRAAIEEAIKINPDLGNESISVVFFPDLGLARSQQMFSDLNQHAVKPTRSLSILYNHRDALGNMIKEVIKQIPIFKMYTEYEKTTISNRSIKTFTLSAIYQANQTLLDLPNDVKTVTTEHKDLVRDFWIYVTKFIKEWQMLINKTVNPSELRKNYVHVHGVILSALGIVGRDLVNSFPQNWHRRLANIKKIDWSRVDNPAWQDRLLTPTGKISKSRDSIILTSNYIKSFLDLPLSEHEQAVEQKLYRSKEA